MISADTIERIYATARIDEVVGNYVTLRRRGANLVGLCPFHDEKTGSFTVSPAKGLYKCFGCGKAGHVVGFIMEIEQCSYADALRLLAKKYNIPIVETERTPEEIQKNDDKESMLVLNEFATEWFEKQLWETEEGTTIGLSYFRERGLLDTTIKKFHLGYSPDKSNAFYQTAHEKGYDDKFLLNDPETEIGTGLCGKSESGTIYDRFRGRVMFPIRNRSGRTVAFAGRILKNKENVGKYVNSPSSLVYSKTNQLYGFYQARQAISKLDLCYLVEGQMDVLSMYQAGIENVVCSGGTALTQPQIRLIQPLTQKITIIYDGDKAGIHAALRGIDMFLEEGFAVKVVLLPEGEDPDSFARTHNASDFMAYIAENQTDFIRFKAKVLSEHIANDPSQKSAIIRDVMTSVAIIPDVITRQVYIRECSNLFNMQEQLLSLEVEHIRVEKRAEAQKTLQRAQTTLSSVKMEPIPKFSTPIDTKIYQQEKKLEKNYRNIVQIMVNYGGCVLQRDEQNTVRVADFILNTLQEDNLQPKNDTHNKILQLCYEHQNDPDFSWNTFFVRHPDIQISQLGVELLEDEPKTFADCDTKLYEWVYRLLCELKLTFVDLQILYVTKKISENKDNEGDLKQLMNQHMQLLNIRKVLQEILGLI